MVPSEDDRLDGGVAVVLALGQDKSARRAVNVVGAALGTSKMRTAFWALEDFLEKAGQQADLCDWADTMRRRYLTGP